MNTNQINQIVGAELTKELAQRALEAAWVDAETCREGFIDNENEQQD